MIDLRQLRQFVALGTELHFRKAAERLHMTQPPLSQAMKKLEEDLGVELLIRNKKQVTLTSAGEVFLKEAKRILQQAERAKDLAKLAHEGAIGHLAVGFVGSATYEILPKALQQYRSLYPNVVMDLLELTTLQQFEALADDNIQVGLLRPTMSTDTDLMVRTIAKEDMVVVLPKNHPLVSKTAVSLNDLASDSLITFSQTHVPSMFNKINLACHESGFTPKLGQSALQIQTMMSLVAGGLGVSLIPLSASHALHDGVTMRELVNCPPTLQVELAVAWRQSAANPMLDAFIDVCSKSGNL